MVGEKGTEVAPQAPSPRSRFEDTVGVRHAIRHQTVAVRLVAAHA